jgi:hypothetical protein
LQEENRMTPTRDPYQEKAADPDDHFTMTDCERAGERLIEAVQEFRDAYRAQAVAAGCKPDDDNTYDCLIDIIHGTWGTL